MNFPFAAGTKIVEIGGGDNPQFRPNIDIRPGPHVDMVADLNQPFPLEDNSVEGIYSSYIIEHISWRNVRNFIKEMHRILQPGGQVFVITANLLEQARMIVDGEELTDREVCAIFGDQNYAGSDWRANSHCCGFSPQSAIKMFREAGFTDIFTFPHPNCPTDLIIEARKEVTKIKAPINPEVWTKEQRQIAYDKEYFDGGKVVGGYAHEGYWDYPIHWNTARKVAELNPESVLELGCARGYILKKLEDSGIRVGGLEVSKHCQHTRAILNIMEWDITETPWPIPDNSYDLCFSIAVMEHIPEDKVASITAEIRRTCKRALHGISFNGDVDDFDKTHTTLRDAAWWKARLPENHLVIDKEELEKGPPAPPLGIGDTQVKLNIGSFTTMFHHGWINMDIVPLHAWAARNQFAFQQHDARIGIPYADNSVDLICTSHFLEHLTYEEGAAFLKECQRVLKPGGVMRTIVPDIHLLASQCFGEDFKQRMWFDDVNAGCAASETPAKKFWSLAMSGHAAGYDQDTLVKALDDAEFASVHAMGFRRSVSQQILVETIDMLPTLSLYVDAVK